MKTLWRIVAFSTILCVSPAVDRLPADDLPADDSAPASFQGIVENHVRRTFDAVADYVNAHPQARDVEQAYAWLFQTALRHDLVSKTTELASAYLDRDSEGQSSRSLARRVKALGLMQQGRTDESLSVLDEQLAVARLRSPNESVDFASSLAAEAQIAGQIDAARAVYQRLAQRMLLNPYVRQLCERRLARLDLVGRKAPQIGVTDLAGNGIDLSSFAGKVVLVDFWATNCPPCLKEFPNMVRTYERYKDRGFEIVGISLDEETSQVAAFQDKWQLPWPLALSHTDNEATRERYRAVTIPSMFLVDRKGNIVAADVRGPQFERAVAQMFSN